MNLAQKQATRDIIAELNKSIARTSALQLQAETPEHIVMLCFFDRVEGFSTPTAFAKVEGDVITHTLDAGQATLFTFNDAVKYSDKVVVKNGNGRMKAILLTLEEYKAYEIAHTKRLIEVITETVSAL
jgi:hypothetical protein